MSPPRLQGVFTALVTPFKDNLVDIDCFVQLCTRQIDAGIAGLVPCGTTGETPALTAEEWELLIETTVRISNKRVPVIAGCGTNATASTVANIKRAQELGADAALVVFPYYNKPNRSGLVEHVRQACAVGLPIVLYHVPGRTGQRLTADVLEALCRTPGVVGLKEATGDVTLGQELINRLADTDVSLLSGDDFTYAALIAMGFDGAISVLSNPEPEQSVAWCTAAKNGDIATLQQLRFELLPMVFSLFAETNPIPCKKMMAKQGLLTYGVRLPLM
jgi:4-hydroxy-tetrahydrodipicolinate synthase